MLKDVGMAVPKTRETRVGYMPQLGRLDSVEWNGGMEYWNGLLKCPTHSHAYVKCTGTLNP